MFFESFKVAANAVAYGATRAGGKVRNAVLKNDTYGQLSGDKFDPKSLRTSHKKMSWGNQGVQDTYNASIRNLRKNPHSDEAAAKYKAARNDYAKAVQFQDKRRAQNAAESTPTYLAAKEVQDCQAKYNYLRDNGGSHEELAQAYHELDKAHQNDSWANGYL